MWSVPSEGHLCLFLPWLLPGFLLSVELSSRSCPPALCLLVSQVILLHGVCGCHVLRTLLCRAGVRLGLLWLLPSPAPAAGAEKRQEEEHSSEWDGRGGDCVMGAGREKDKNRDEKWMGDPAQLWCCWWQWVNVCGSRQHPAGLASAPRKHQGLGKTSVMIQANKNHFFP